MCQDKSMFQLLKMNTARCKVVRIILQRLLLKHIIHFVFVAVISVIFKQVAGNSCETFVQVILSWILNCILGEGWLNSLIYKSCYGIGIVLWIYVSWFVINVALGFIRYHFVTKHYKSKNWPAALYLISVYFAQDLGLNFIPMIPFHVSVLLLILTYVVTGDRVLGMKGYMILISLIVVSNKWCELWILLQMCLIMAVTLEYITSISIFFFETFLPGLYAVPLKDIKLVLEQDLNHVISVIVDSGVCNEEEEQISTVYTNLFVEKKSQLHIVYRCGSPKVSEYTCLLLTEEPYADPNYCDKHGHFPFWYIIEKCCNYSRRGRSHLVGYYPSVFGSMFQKTFILEFLINVQAGLRISKCSEKAMSCLQHVIDETDESEVFLFLQEAGILRHFQSLAVLRSDKWNDFNYPLSLKRLCGNITRISLRKNAFLGVKHLCSQGYLPNTSDLREFITLCDIFSNFRELVDCVVHN